MSESVTDPTSSFLFFQIDDAPFFFLTSFFSCRILMNETQSVPRREGSTGIPTTCRVSRSIASWIVTLSSIAGIVIYLTYHAASRSVESTNKWAFATP